MSNSLNICAICRNEGPYLKEWIEYHRALGVDRVIVYNNGSTDLSQTILNGTKGCRVHQIPGNAKQLEAYNKYILTYRKDSTWTAFIDVDEFIVPLEGESIPKFLYQFENKYQVAGLGCQWRLFGSNGQLHYESKPVVERFTRRAFEVNPHIKCIVKNDYLNRALSPHWFDTSAPILNENFRALYGSLTPPEVASANRIQINHYAVKSRAESMERRRFPRSDTGTMRPEEIYFAAHDVNEVEDLRALELYNKLVRKIIV